MSVIFKDNIFTIETKNTMYQMKADKFGVLLHLWYGKKTEQDMSYLLNYGDVGFSGNINDSGNERTYSCDTLPLEYSAIGNGDYRTPALVVKNSDGSKAVDLRYFDHKISKGKYSINGLPAVYDEKNEADTLEIILKDKFSETYVTLKYGIFEEYDIITRSVTIKNKNESDIILEKAASFCLDITENVPDLIHFHGRHCVERMFERTKLHHGVTEFGSRRGTSSHHNNPSFILADKNCTEDKGNCYGFVFMYSGSFKTEIELDQLDQTRSIMGINEDLFEWTLKKGDEFDVPEVIMSFSPDGFEKLSHNFHHIIRNNVCRGKYKTCERPVLINNWEATYFDFDEEKIYKIAKQASELGVDMMVLDDGWFGKRDTDNSGLGDWFVNENKIKGGLGKLVERVKSTGMKFGIWFEPEMISEDSDLYRSHPEWAIKIPDRDPVRGRNQLVLDMSNPDVTDYLYKCISDILESADISYIKWDMNRSICDWYSSILGSKYQGELPHRYILGLYDLLERIEKAYPDVLFEGCSGGGGRFDAGMMYYTPQIWCSDDTDAFERTKIQYGTSFFYPISTVGSHVSTVPNHQTGRVISMSTRGIVAMAGSFGYELDLNLISDEEKEAVKAQIKNFKKYGPIIHNGKYYRLTDTMNDNVSAWEFVSDDKSEALVQAVVYRSKPNYKPEVVVLRGLDENKKYKCEFGTYTGASLMNGGIPLKTGPSYVNGGIVLPAKQDDNNAYMIHLKEC